ncbi:MAG: Flp1 family type IVb pilin [Lachnospiraceae bacterium]|nr:Flp1 family type IVb pilin [Lachnospiraceae bacterium]
MIGRIKETLTNKIFYIKERIRSHFINVWKREDGMGVVEVILITVVLIALVIIFKKQISSVVNTILSKMSNQANQV